MTHIMFHRKYVVKRKKGQRQMSKLCFRNRTVFLSAEGFFPTQAILSIIFGGVHYLQYVPLYNKKYLRSQGGTLRWTGLFYLLVLVAIV